MSDHEATPAKRFIAGAVCPECRILDRIVVEVHEGVRRRRCVSCGYVDVQASGAGQPPATRFSRRSRPDDGAVSPVKIVDPRRQPAARNEESDGKPESG